MVIYSLKSLYQTHLPLNAIVLFLPGSSSLALIWPCERRQGALNRVHLFVSYSRLKVSEHPLTPFLGLCTGRPEVHCLTHGWLCHVGASWGSRAMPRRWLDGGVRVESRRWLWTLAANKRGFSCLEGLGWLSCPAYPFFLDLALMIISGAWRRRLQEPQTNGNSICSAVVCKAFN